MILPWHIRWLMLAGLGLALFMAGWAKGVAHEQRTQLDAQRDAAVQIVQVERKQAAVSQQVVQRHEAGRARDRMVTKTIEREVIRYVQATSNNDCRIDRDWLRLHTAAVMSADPDSPRVADATATSATAGDVLATDASNYAACHETTRQLVDLQAWLQAQQLAAGEDSAQDSLALIGGGSRWAAIQSPDHEPHDTASN